MKLEFKELNLKATEEGTFKGIASPYNNIDLGGDRVLPTVGKKNAGKKVPMLYQHDTHMPIGEMVLSDGEKGVECEAKFFLDKDTDNNYMLPKAAEAYLLAKKGILKLSIGYYVKEYEYVKEEKQTVRDLKDIDIVEVSCVTFPMNPEATITDVKEVHIKEDWQKKIEGMEKEIEELKALLQPKKEEKETKDKIEEMKVFISSVKDEKTLEEIKEAFKESFGIEEEQETKEELGEAEIKALQELFENVNRKEDE